MGGEDEDTIVEEQAALRRVAMLVARGVESEAVFASVAAEAAALFDADIGSIVQLGPGPGEVTRMAAHGLAFSGPGTRFDLGPRFAAYIDQWRAGQVIRFEEDYLGSTDVPAEVRAEMSRCSVNAAILVDGRIWGLMGVGSRSGRLPDGIEERLLRFTELTSLAVVSAQARSELRDFAEEQAALRRVATQVARGAPPRDVFMAVVEEAGRLLRADSVLMFRYDPDGSQPCVGSWGDGQPGASVDAPIWVGGRRWGLISAISRSEPLAAGAEDRLAKFTELAATAIANAQARTELREFAEEQAALRRVAMLVAGAAPADVVLAVVTKEAGRLLGTDHAVTARFNPDHSRTLISSWSSTGTPLREGARSRLGGRNVHTIVFDTGGPARIDDYATGASGMSARDGLAVGLRAAVAVPISIEGRLWGSMAVASTKDEPLPSDTEERLSGFTALAATAIANAEARVALTASRERIVVAADATRRRIERELRDATQERLVSLVTQLKTVQAAAPEMSGLGSVLAEADDVLEQLRKIARGLHPSALADGGLPPALTALARNSAVPVRLDVQVPARLAERAELTAYYAVSEALTNIAKHADASMADVSITADDRALRVRVRDDGLGGADFSRGSGLTGLRDRVEAVGGQLSLRSPGGAGTTVEISLPL